ncbi:MAG: DEAD/DEAH box helicase [Wenzhouxiangellaceae bacterium]
MTNPDPPERRFADLGLPDFLLATLAELGYEAPSPIQSATIPALLAGSDVLGQAQTGTGKTAAFALPILARFDPAARKPSALVLAPTRELAIQVAEAFHRYASHIRGFHVLPIYGGQAYGPQLAGLRRGADVIVGTPGRVIDHLEKGTLRIDALDTLVLDEADEMLRMGFVDEVGKVLERIPESCQKVLFSATMPDAIRRIANRHLRDAEHVTIRSKTTTAASIHQRYWVVGGVHKLDALTRILEVEPFDAMLVFARTRVATEELAGRLEARGFSAAALNGDVPQKQREKIVDRLKRGDIDILVATDVAARGLDVERISHVVNYDIPYDTEAYVHRIGRTGRAGRSGEAILFVAPRERGMLRAIERATRQPIEAMSLPTAVDVNEKRLERFHESVAEALESAELQRGREVVRSTLAATGASIEDLAAALVLMARGDQPLLREEKPSDATMRRAHKASPSHPARPDAGPQTAQGKNRRGDEPRNYQQKRKRDAGADFVTYRVAVGHAHGAKPGNIVGAIANEAGLSARQIGRIDIHDAWSQVDLPSNLSKGALDHLKKVWVAGQQLDIALDDGSLPAATSGRSPSSEQTASRTTPHEKTGKEKGKGKETRRGSLEKPGSGHRPKPSAGDDAPSSSAGKPKRSQNRPPRNRSERKALLGRRKSK